MSGLARTLMFGTGMALLAVGSPFPQMDLQAARSQGPNRQLPRAQPAHLTASTQSSSPTSPTSAAPQPRAVFDKYCVTCHSDRLKTGGLTLQSLDVNNVPAAAEILEKVVGKLRAAAMPPPGLPRPDKATYATLATSFETALDRAAATNPNPGRQTVHRLNRFEYGNAIRDLVGVEVDVETLLPPDDEDEGFDNIADALSVSPTLMERYMTAGRRISQLAIGDPAMRLRIDTYTVPESEVQEDHTHDALPFGTRGGLAARHYFALDGEYSVRIRLRRNFYHYIRGIGNEPHQIDLRLDGARVKSFMVGGEHKGTKCVASFCGSSGMGDAAWEVYATHADDPLEVRIPIKAGMRTVSAAFVKKPALSEGVLQPTVDISSFGYSTDEEMDGNPAVASVTISGPFNGKAPTETASRQKIFVCTPSGAADEERCAKQITGTLARRAFRRPVTSDDVRGLMSFYEAGRQAGGFDGGIQSVVERLLADPEFVFRVERDPVGRKADAYRISDLELASRLSFFLWSSIPDDELLDAAARGRLHEPKVLQQQVRRMLADARSNALVDNFAGQWLEVRKIRNVAPDPTVFPEFDQNLRDAMQTETERFLQSQVREDRSVIDLLRANYTFVNERLAKHYGIPNVFGSHFRRVTFPDDRRGGLLGQASILTLTSYSTRTSPVLRGKWLLENLLGTPPPPPPATVPALKEAGEDGQPPASGRARLEAHRKNPVCATCHRAMDPLGFALENFDAIGQYRTTDDVKYVAQPGPPIDSSGELPDGTKISGSAGLRQLLLSRQHEFARTVTRKLLTYALGRRVEYYDMPVVRQILRDAAESNYRWSSLIGGIVNSTPFQMRRRAES